MGPEELFAFRDFSGHVTMPFFVFVTGQPIVIVFSLFMEPSKGFGSETAVLHLECSFKAVPPGDSSCGYLVYSAILN